MHLSARQGKLLCYFDLKDHDFTSAMNLLSVGTLNRPCTWQATLIHWTEQALLIARHEFRMLFGRLCRSWTTCLEDL